MFSFPSENVPAPPSPNCTFEYLSSFPVLKKYKIKIIDTNGFKAAQVTAGGIPLSEVNLENLESKKVKNLYFAGEILDVYGECGGFNLQWAWTSGYFLGKKL